VVLGGPVTAEALAWGLTRGLAIWALMVIFGAFNALVDHHRLLRLAPPALFHAGLAVTIALAFVPSLLRAIGEIGQAQRARGHRFGGPRSFVPLVSPLLAGSLEKAIQLAEALDARGYGRAGERLAPWRQAALILGAPLLGAGLFAWLYYGAAGLPWALALGGAGMLCLALATRALGREAPRSSYRRERWRRRDSLTVGASALVVLALAALRLGGAELVYYPFPRIVAPGFDLRAGLALLLLATPAAVAGREPPPRTPRRGVVRRSALVEETPQMSQMSQMPGERARGRPDRVY
jgi:energy-coupling factor transport system permease protein